MNSPKRQSDMDLLCQFCGEYTPENTDWIETHEGDVACETCQYDACACFGQDRNNIRHTSMLERLIIRWSKE